MCAAVLRNDETLVRTSSSRQSLGGSEKRMALPAPAAGPSWPPHFAFPLARVLDSCAGLHQRFDRKNWPRDRFSPVCRFTR
jgi:hypothetical protein